MIKLKLTDAQLQALFQKGVDNVVNAMVQRLQYTGEQFVTDVRTKINADDSYRAAMRKISGRPKVTINADTPRYADDTANLTSSVGFMVLNQAKVVQSSFPGAGMGKTVGEAAAKEVGARFPTGLALVVVAGMQYAAAVESLGYDVLTGSSFVAENELKAALQALLKR